MTHPNRLWAGFKQFLSAYCGQKRKQCSHCGGGRCIGACGNNSAGLKRSNIQGEVCLLSDEQGAIISNNQIILRFQANTYFGRLILKKCPPGTPCEIHAMVKADMLGKLISVRKLM